MNGSRLQRRERRAGQCLLAACALATVVGGAWLGGCGIGLAGADFSLASAFDAGASYASAGEGGASDGALTLAPDPSVDGAVAVTGSGGGYGTASTSPLCGITAVTCDPDELACVAAPPATGGGLDAGVIAVDAGVTLADAGATDVATQLGCRVTAAHSEAGTAAGMPACGAAGSGQNDTPCSASTDCAASFECVIDSTHADGSSTASPGVCRSYCCDNVCSGTDSYCDIETTVTGSVAVPVCVVRAGGRDAGVGCTLLDDSSCAAPLTCQVVSANGQAACVVPGMASAGESCETTKCAEGLSCVLGYFPARTCAQLCKLQNDDCPSGQECMQDPSVTTTNPTVGVCENEG